MNSESAAINECLAYVVLTDPDSWLGSQLPTDFAAFIGGADLRASVTQPDFLNWRISGPLDQSDFYEPIVSRTGRPNLSIRWATALELLHYSPESAFAGLRRLVEDWFRGGRVDIESKVHAVPIDVSSEQSIDRFWQQLATRPAMYMGDSSGWTMQCFLKGMLAGGDWLNLPPFPKLEEVVRRIEDVSRASYGSAFGGYRVYSSSPGEILKWAGIS